MQALRLAVPALALAAVLSSVFLSLGFVSAARTVDNAPGGRYVAAGTSPERAPLEKGGTPSTSTPVGDAWGEPIPGLPRHPGSVRVAYAEDRVNGLAVVRAGYLAEKPPGEVRDFYDGVFRSGRWSLANVEYSGGDWLFLAVRGGDEADVVVSPGGGGSMVEVEFSRPLGQEDGSAAGGSKR